ncbi:DUF3307 domain-containing protein [bacterium]|nr:DUF3307 domain-containing protein [bacterium]
MTGTTSTALAAMLVAGHALGDFVFQSDAMIRRKERFAGVALHALAVTAFHVALLVPFFAGPMWIVLAGIAVGHVLIDSGKVAVSRRAPAWPLRWFTIDQLAHLVVLAAAWWWLLPRVTLAGAVPVDAATLTTAGVFVAAFAFNLGGMSAIVGMTLQQLGIRIDEGGPAVGRIIGMLERMFVLTLILLDRWEALGLLVAAKSLARFKALDNRQRAEYYLVGTLVSLFGATVTALAVRALLGRP